MKNVFPHFSFCVYGDLCWKCLCKEKILKDIIKKEDIIMKWIDKLERKYGRFGIPNLTVYIIACYIIGYMLQMFSPSIVPMLNLNVAMILRGQVWRLVTWILSPPDSGNLMLFMISIVFFYYPIGNALERTWGSFRYTLYILSGMLFTVIGAFILYFITGGVLDYWGINVFTTYYISLSVFLAFATIYPDMQILLFFVIPLKMKWMAIVYVVILVYQMLKFIQAGVWYFVVPVIASLFNYILFFLSTRDTSRINPKQVKRRYEFRKAMEPQSRTSSGTSGHSGRSVVTKHKCAICGRTEADDPNLEFRFCSRCNGNYEYCQDHLFTHTHIQ